LEVKKILGFTNTLHVPSIDKALARTETNYCHKTYNLINRQAHTMQGQCSKGYILEVHMQEIITTCAGEKTSTDN
jgi:hypothetical protein